MYVLIIPAITFSPLQALYLLCTQGCICAHSARGRRTLRRITMPCSSGTYVKYWLLVIANIVQCIYYRLVIDPTEIVSCQIELDLDWSLLLIL